MSNTMNTDRNKQGLSNDELLARYREASANESAAPNARVRAAVLAKAQAVATSRSADTVQAIKPEWKKTPAANDGRWRWSAAAALVAAGVSGVFSYLWLQPKSEERTAVLTQSAPAATRESSLESTATPALVATPSPSTTPEKASAAPPLVYAPPPAQVATLEKSKQAQSSSVAVTQPKVAESKVTADAAVRSNTASATVARETQSSAAKEPEQAIASAASAVRAPMPTAAPAAPPPPPSPAAPSLPSRDVASVASSAAVASAAPALSSNDADAARLAGGALETQKRATLRAPAAEAAPAASPAMASASPPTVGSTPPTASARAEIASGVVAAEPSKPTLRMKALNQLQSAVRAGDVSAVEAALTNGGDANSTMEDGTPLIIYAARRNQIEVVERLLRAGASASARDRLGKSAIDYARDADNAEMLRRLQRSVNK
jgi:hypothetical protein